MGEWIKEWLRGPVPAWTLLVSPAVWIILHVIMIIIY
jgi:hypothetical protein